MMGRLAAEIPRHPGAKIEVYAPLHDERQSGAVPVKKVTPSAWNAARCRCDWRRCSPRIATRSNSPAVSLLASHLQRLLGSLKYLMIRALSAMSPVDFAFERDFLRESSLRAGRFGIVDTPTRVPIVRASRTGHPVRRGRAPWHPARGKPYRRVSCSL